MPDGLPEVLGTLMVGGGIYAGLLARVRRRDRYAATPAWVHALRRLHPGPTRWGLPSPPPDPTDLASRETHA